MRNSLFDPVESHYSLKEGTYFHVHIFKKLQLIIIYVYRKGKKPKNVFVEGVGVYNGTKNILVEIMAGGMGLKSSAKLNGSLLTLPEVITLTLLLILSLHYPENRY